MARLKRSVFRLSIIAAGLLWLVVLLSCFVGRYVQGFVWLDEATRSQWSFSLETHVGGMTVGYIPDGEPYIDADSENFVEFYGQIGKPTERDARFSWLIPRNTSPYMSSHGKLYSWEIPLVSPAIVLSAIPILMAIRAGRRTLGCCVACGYDLTGITGVCPECGADGNGSGGERS